MGCVRAGAGRGCADSEALYASYVSLYTSAMSNCNAPGGKQMWKGGGGGGALMEDA
jgi:hypothetical protein